MSRPSKKSILSSSRMVSEAGIFLFKISI